MNEDFEPTPQQERVLEVFAGEGRCNPRLVREQTGLPKQRVNDALRDLVNAGWIRHVTRGLYEFVGDPRNDT